MNDIDRKNLFLNLDLSLVTNVFIWDGRCVAIEKSGNIHKISFRKQSVQIDDYFKLLEKWKESLGSPVSNCFEYPIWVYYKKIILDTVIQTASILGLLVTFLLFFNLINNDRYLEFIKALFVVWGILSTMSLVRLVSYKKLCRFNKICLNEDSIKIYMIDGKVEDFSIDDIEDYYFATKARNCYVVFNNKRKLFHLERLSYWPVLRKYLLDRLENAQ